MLNNNALVATGNVIIPIEPGSSAIGGYKRTMERLIEPAREYIDVDVLAVVPNKLSDRIDHRTEDRELLENLNTATYEVNDGQPLQEVVPEFARITGEEFDRIDDGEMQAPKPGIRHRSALSRSLQHNQPLQDYAPESDQIDCYRELAEIVSNGDQPMSDNPFDDLGDDGETATESGVEGDGNGAETGRPASEPAGSVPANTDPEPQTEPEPEPPSESGPAFEYDDVRQNLSTRAVKRGINSRTSWELPSRRSFDGWGFETTKPVKSTTRF